jgi:hypothetical protein
MTIPLDNLYHYIEGLCPEPVCMYLFYPHGSKNISDMQRLNNKSSWAVVYPIMICYDQEPLNYQHYQTHQQEDVDRVYEFYKKHVVHHIDKTILEKSNLSLVVNAWANLYDKIILLHSEKNSVDLKLYQDNGYIDVYYWCHAFIARDWYRFAEHDVRLISNTTPTKDFLIYCRDWSGSREYRIKFQELLFNQDLVKNSITGIMKKNGNGEDLENAKFVNKNFIPSSNDFFYNLLNNNILSSESANYCPNNFNESCISIVLETVFDGSKIHLTEKILRPIACGHPFILAAGPGSLEYLRSYGFKTFSPWLNEEYDLESDSLLRLKKIIQSMKNFTALPIKEKKEVYDNIVAIAKYNKERFFSKEFDELVLSELKENISNALVAVKKTRSLKYRGREKNHQTKHLRKDLRKFVAQHLNRLRKLNPPGQ